MTPALLTRMSSAPSAAAVSATAVSTEARSVTSSRIGTAVPPRSPISSQTRAARSTRRAAAATLAPAPARTAAKWRPRPLEAPVTNADLPERSKRNGVGAVAFTAGKMTLRSGVAKGLAKPAPMTACPSARETC